MKIHSSRPGSIVFASSNNGSSISILASATGGDGGLALAGTGRAPGHADARIAGTSKSGDVMLFADAISGVSGNGSPALSGGDSHTETSGAVGGDGGSLTIGRDFELSLGAIGGNGRTIGRSLRFAETVAFAGNGGNASSRSKGRATGDSVVVVRDRAAGGTGSSTALGTNAIAGFGGHADSKAVGYGMGNAAVDVAALAIGGDGGLTDDLETQRRQGGNASAKASAFGKGMAQAKSTAIAGLGGVGLVGDAVAQATAQSQNSAVALSTTSGAGPTRALFRSVLWNTARPVHGVQVEVSAIGSGGGGALAAAHDALVPFATAMSSPVGAPPLPAYSANHTNPTSLLCREPDISRLEKNRTSVLWADRYVEMSDRSSTSPRSNIGCRQSEPFRKDEYFRAPGV